MVVAIHVCVGNQVSIVQHPGFVFFTNYTLLLNFPWKQMVKCWGFLFFMASAAFWCKRVPCCLLSIYSQALSHFLCKFTATLKLFQKYLLLNHFPVDQNTGASKYLGDFYLRSALDTETFISSFKPCFAPKWMSSTHVIPCNSSAVCVMRGGRGEVCGWTGFCSSADLC